MSKRDLTSRHSFTITVGSWLHAKASGWGMLAALAIVLAVVAAAAWLGSRP